MDFAENLNTTLVFKRNIKLTKNHFDSGSAWNTQCTLFLLQKDMHQNVKGHYGVINQSASVSLLIVLSNRT